LNFEESSSKEDKKYMFFRQHFLYTEIRKPIKMVKAFILDTAFKNDYKVE
jgi:hypothetical protein